jgi:DNA recombination protein RmuC
MEFIYLALGIIIGAVLIYFILKSATVSRNDFETLNGEFIKTKTDYENLNQKNKELQDLSGQLNEDLDNERKLFRQIKDENTSSNTEIKFLSDKVTDLQEDNRLHKEKIQEYRP